MDKRLILVAFALVIASTLFFCYRKFLLASTPIEMSVAPNENIFTGQSITFKDYTKDVDYRVWSFGDGEYSSDQQGKHTYLNRGNYTLQLTIADAFGTRQSRQFPITVLHRAAATLEIEGDSIVEPGTAATYTTPVDAGSMVWTLQGESLYSGKVQKGRVCSWIMKTPGPKKLLLQTSNPEHLITKNITVTERPVVNLPTAPRPLKPASRRSRPSSPAGDPDEGPDDHGEGVSAQPKEK